MRLFCFVANILRFNTKIYDYFALNAKNRRYITADF